MKINSSISFVLFIVLIGCHNSNNIPDSKTIAEEIKILQQHGIFGQWECQHSGYESIISFKKEEGETYSIIDFSKNNSLNKTETLKKFGVKYFVINSKAKEYYIINNNNDLELWDEQGLFSIARNIWPDKEVKAFPKFKRKESIGENLFFITGEFSKSSPETLAGTNNTFWIVYYKDLNVTFKVKKSTDTIVQTKKGRISNL